MWSANKIRKTFIDYFHKRGHVVKESSSLVCDDPSILFTTAGMVQFKPLFFSTNPPYRRATSCQRCLRTQDLHLVGRTPRHHTFFEMLGNFSFGDYFKEDALIWAWDLITNVFSLDEDRLWVSVYYEDEEAEKIWKKILKNKQRIIKRGKEDNFWQMGDEGPCGPCSEIIFDQGETVGCRLPTCNINCDCGRFLELWNIVFMEFDRKKDSTLVPLSNKNIDTGMGLERIAAVLQDVNSNFDTDLLAPIIKYITKELGTVYKKNEDIDISLRIIADHLRAIATLIYDGVLPSNEKRGYVLRLLIRRTITHINKISTNKINLYKFIPYTVNVLTESIADIIKDRERIAKVVKTEEENFAATLEKSLYRLQELIEQAKKTNRRILSGAEIFKLYDTYGLPTEVANDLLIKEGLSFDRQEFEKCLDQQRYRSRKETIFTPFKAACILPLETEFIGYEQDKCETEIVGIFKDQESLNELVLNSDNIKEPITLILKQTPFYFTSGGQIHDIGELYNNLMVAEVISVEKQMQAIAHKIKIKKINPAEIKIKIGDKITAQIDIENRQKIARNHTATHLLHATLRNILGKHVRQAGSFVGPEYLRFDFTHYEQLNENILKKIEEIINSIILKNEKVQTFIMDKEEAIKQGAIALFDEEYTQKVRVVKIKDISVELCGGTHVSSTGSIGLFKIVSEKAIAKDTRRIEAKTAQAAYKFLQEKEELVEQIKELLKVSQEKIIENIEKLIETNKETAKKIDMLNTRLHLMQASICEPQIINQKKVLIYNAEDVSANVLRNLSDKLITKSNDLVIILYSIDKEKKKVLWLVRVGKELKGKVNASYIVNKLAQATGGSGGGREDFAQGGGSCINKLKEAISEEFLKFIFTSNKNS